MMKRQESIILFCIGILFGFLISLFVTSPAVAKDEITLKCATYTPSGSKHTAVVYWWAEELEKRSNGRVKVRVYAGGSLVKAKEMLNAGKTGLADIVQIVPAYDPSKLVLTGAPYKPFNTAPRLDQTSLAFNELVKNKYVKREIEKLNLKYLFMNPTGPYNIMGKKPIKNISDLRGIKIRSTGDYSILLKEFGAVPVYVTAPEMYDALSKGMVDEVMHCSHSSFHTYKVDEASKNGYYMDNMNLGLAYTIQAINKDKYNGLPDDIKEIIKELSYDIPKKTQEFQYSQKVNERYYEIFRELGIQSVKFSAQDRAKMVNKADDFLDRWVADWESKGLEAGEVMREWKEIMKKMVQKSPNGL